MVQQPFIYKRGSAAEYSTMYFRAADFTPATIESVSGYYVNNSFLFGIIPPFTGATTERDIAGKIGITEITFTCDLPETDTMLTAYGTVNGITYMCVIQDHHKIVDGAWVAASGESAMVVFAFSGATPTAMPNSFVLSMPVPNFVNESAVAEAKTPVAADLLTGKEAWANGVKIVGEGSGGGGGSGYQRVSGVPDIEAIINDAEPINYGGVMDTRYVSDLQSGLVFLLSEDCPTLTVEVKIDGVLLPQDGNYQVHSGTPDYVVFVNGKQPTGDKVTTIEYNYTTYYPMYILCDYANYIEKTYTKTGTGVATLADAYIFSDAPTTLEVGTSVTHTWDVTKDFTTVEGWGCRWIMMYGIFATKESAAVTIYDYNSTFECVTKDIKFASGASFFGYSTNKNYSLRYLKFGEDTRLHRSHSNGFCRFCTALEEIIVDGTRDSISVINSNYLFAQNYALKKVTFSDSYSYPEGDYFLNGCPSLKEINLGGVYALAFEFSAKLPYIELKSSLTTIRSLPYAVKYIKLYNGFNISGVNWSGYASSGYTKSIQWFYDLAEWLYDRSGDTAGSLVLGANNIAILNSLYLEDGTTPLTSIYDAKNWTRS